MKEINYIFNQTYTIEEIYILYQPVGWSNYLHNPEKTVAGINHSQSLAARLDDGTLVGLIRGITDEQTILFIQDILVIPKLQGQHIGTTLMKKFLVAYPTGQTVLLTDQTDKTKSFYESLGFITVANYGAAYVRDIR